jgi:hypothetical protein
MGHMYGMYVPCISRRLKYLPYGLVEFVMGHGLKLVVCSNGGIAPFVVLCVDCCRVGW